MNGYNAQYSSPNPIQPPSVDLKKAKRAYSTICFSLCGIIAILYIIEFIIAKTVDKTSWLMTSDFGNWILDYAPMYLAAIPIGIMLMRFTPSIPLEKKGFSGKEFFVCLTITFFFVYVGSMMGNYLSAFFSSGTVENTTTDFAMDTNPFSIVTMVLLTPMIEEYVFRKQIIDRTAIYGEKTAVLFSGLLFGLFHTNMFQFFYGFLAGTLFAYVYLRTGKLRYPILLHTAVKLIGSVIAPYILSKIDLDALYKLQNLDPEAHFEEYQQLTTQLMPGATLMMIYYLAFLGTAITGLVFLIKNRRKSLWSPAKEQLPHSAVASTVYMNLGMITFVTITVALTVISVFK